MARGTLYDRLGVAPDADAAALRAAFAAQLAATPSDDEHAALLTLRATLLDPTSRHAYNRLHNLPMPAAHAAGADAWRAALDHEARAAAGGGWGADLRFAGYLALVALLLALWALALALWVAPLAVQLVWPLALLGWRVAPTTAAALLLSALFLPLAAGAIMVWDRALQATGRMMLLLLLLGALLWGGTRWLSRAASLGALTPLIAWLLLFTLCLLLLRWLGRRDLERILQRGARRR